MAFLIEKHEGALMKRIIIVMGLVMILLLLWGCGTPPSDSGDAKKMPSIAPSDQKLLEQHPDDLDSALKELDAVG